MWHGSLGSHGSWLMADMARRMMLSLSLCHKRCLSLCMPPSYMSCLDPILYVMPRRHVSIRSITILYGHPPSRPHTPFLFEYTGFVIGCFDAPSLPLLSFSRCAYTVLFTRTCLCLCACACACACVCMWVCVCVCVCLRRQHNVKSPRRIRHRKAP